MTACDWVACCESECAVEIAPPSNWEMPGMLIVDGHLDLALNALQGNRDLLVDVWTTRVRESHDPGKGKGKGTVALPEMRQGRIAVCFTTAHAFCTTGRFIPHMDYGSPAQAHAMARAQLAYYEALDRQGHVRILTSCEQLDAHMTEWTAWDADPAADPRASATSNTARTSTCRPRRHACIIGE